MRFTTQSALPAKWLKHTFSAVCFGAGLLITQLASATTVQFQTPMGNFEVNLYDKTTPETVKNFLAYVNAGAFTNSIVHRSVPGFVIQGGGYKYDETSKSLKTVTKNAAVVNEPVYSNVRGTISMAKTSDNVNSATNQWFFNLADNSTKLDNQNGGFTAFGQVISGIDVLDQIANLNRYNWGSPLNEIPLRNYTAADNTANVPVTDAHLMMIRAIVVLNADPDTAATLNPPKNTLLKTDSDDSGGGSIGLLGLLALGLLALGRKVRLNRA